MTMGGGFAWGVGGVLFGFGLFLAIACAVEEMKQ